MAVLDPPELPVRPPQQLQLCHGHGRGHGAPRLSHSSPLSSSLTGWLGRCQEVANRQWGTGLFRARLETGGGRLLLLACRGLDAARAAPGTTTGESPTASNPQHEYEKARLEQPCLQLSAARGCGHQQQPQTPAGRVQPVGKSSQGTVCQA